MKKLSSNEVVAPVVPVVVPEEVPVIPEEIQVLLDQVVEMEEVLMWLENRLCQHKIKPTGRKDQILEVLQKGPVCIRDLAKQFGMTDRNVSCVVSYLRKDGHLIGKDPVGRLRHEGKEQVQVSTGQIHESAGQGSCILRKAV